MEELREACRLPANIPKSRVNATKGRMAAGELSQNEVMNISNSNAADIVLYGLIKKEVAKKPLHSSQHGSASSVSADHGTTNE